jgi:phospholipid/cholesterol/gamma-HCH transport system substrate-binding protein
METRAPHALIDDPRQVMATISVVAGTPVRADTEAGLEFQGLTGVPVIALTGGASDAAPLAALPSGPPVLIADASAGQSMTEAARQALWRLDTLLADNAGDLKSAISNVNTFAGALARNSNRVDGILERLERMTGSGAAKATIPTYYDLTAPRSFPPSEKAPKSQLVVLEPTALVALDTQRIIVSRSVPTAAESTDNAQWSDTIPKLVQARIVQSFENSNYLGAVARPLEGLNSDYQLAIDLRTFQVLTEAASGTSGRVARVEFAAKIIGEGGRIVGSHTFDATASASDPNVPAAAAALDQAFGRAVTDLVIWTAGII